MRVLGAFPLTLRRFMAIVRGLNGQRLIVPYVSEFADKF